MTMMIHSRKQTAMFLLTLVVLASLVVPLPVLAQNMPEQTTTSLQSVAGGDEIVGAIGYLVWRDQDLDGYPDDGEPGIEGVQVCLYPDLNNNGALDPNEIAAQIGCQLTDDSGVYGFASLPAGHYLVDVDSSNFGAGSPLEPLHLTSRFTFGADPLAVNLSENEDFRAANFGYALAEVTLVKTVAVDGVCAHGQEEVEILPGQQVMYCYTVSNSGETYLAGIQITDDVLGFICQVPTEMAPGESVTCTRVATPQEDVCNVGAASGNPVDEKGDDLIDFPDVGDTDGACVDVLEPAIQLVKLAGDAGDGQVYTIGEPQLVLYTYVVTSIGQTYLEDIVIVDDRGTPGLPADDVTITAAQCAALAGPLAPNGSLTCTQAIMVDADTVNVAEATGAPSDEQGNSLGLPPVQDEDDAEVVLEELGAIGDFVWEDLNGDGIQEFDEPGIEDVLVCLYVDVDANGQYSPGTDTPVVGAGDQGPDQNCLLTDADGAYLFSELPADEYVVVIDASNFQVGGPLEEYVATEPFQGGDAVFDSNGDPITHDAGVILPPAGIDVTIDFGFYRVGALGDFVWIDANGDGIQDALEPGIEDVLLCLYTDVDGDGAYTPGTDEPVVGAGGLGADQNCALTDVDGYYLFSDLPPGDYVVVVDESNFQIGGLLEIFAPTEPFQGSDPVIDSNGNPLTHDAGVALPSGAVDLTIDFGFYQLGSLGDYVWNDANSDGIQELLESGIEDVLVCLYIDVDKDGAFTDGVDMPVSGAGTEPAPNDHCVLTDANGNYMFENLPPGDYVVLVEAGNFADGEPLFECTPSPPFQGADPLLDSNGDPVTHDAGWALGSGENYPGVDFGFSCQPNPVQLLAAETYARELNGMVQVHWATANEANILGYNILRGVVPRRHLAVKINDAMIPSHGQGVLEDAYYRFDDTALEPGVPAYLYWIEVVEADGSTSYPMSPLKVVLTRQRTLFVPVIALD